MYQADVRFLMNSAGKLLIIEILSKWINFCQLSEENIIQRLYRTERRYPGGRSKWYYLPSAYGNIEIYEVVTMPTF